MKWRISAVTIGIVVLIFIAFRNRGEQSGQETEFASESRRASSGELGGISENSAGPSRTKSSQRETLPPPGSHSVQQLKDFILPDIAITGVGLDAALNQVRTAYEETCLKTGESPLTLKFMVPPEKGRKLRVALVRKNFSESVRLLVALSGMKVVRDGSEYRFEEIPEDGKLVKKVLLVPPDFSSALKGLTEQLVIYSDPDDPSITEDVFFPVKAASFQATLAELGLNLDPATQIQLSPSGELAIETTHATDAAAIEALAKIMGETKPKQIKYTAKVIELAAGSDWEPPDVSHLDDAEVQLMMRKLSQKRGADLLTLPSAMAISGQDTKIEIVKGFVPSPDETGHSEEQNVGITLELQGDFLGFGQNVGYQFTATNGEVDPVSGKAVVKTQAELASTGFSKNGNTSLSVQRRPDGSKVLLLVTAAQIDATGRPVH